MLLGMVHMSLTVGSLTTIRCHHLDRHRGMTRVHAGRTRAVRKRCTRWSTTAIGGCAYTCSPNPDQLYARPSTPVDPGSHTLA